MKLTRVVVLAAVAAGMLWGDVTSARADEKPSDLERCFAKVDNVEDAAAQASACEHARIRLRVAGPVTPVPAARQLPERRDPAEESPATTPGDTAGTPAAQDAKPEPDQVAAAIDKGLAAEKAKKDKAAAWVKAGCKTCKLSTAAFVGLVRVQFDSRSGTGDTFEPLSGVGAGVKWRYDTVGSDDELHEIIGVSAGLYFEPKIKVSGLSDNSQALSVLTVFSSFEQLYAGFGLKFASNEPGFSRSFASPNWMFVFGLGVDGSQIVNK